MSDERRLSVVEESDIVRARQEARSLATQLGFSQMDASRITTAVSELTRNIVRYAVNQRGEVTLRPLTNGSSPIGLEIVVQDEGPGIADIDEAMREGYTTGDGMGLGLSGTKRLMDEMLIESVVGKGTTVTIRKWRRG